MHLDIHWKRSFLLDRVFRMIEQINTAWGWLGVKTIELVDSNKFGNVIFRDTDGHFWRLCPEELTCEVISETAEQYNRVTKSNDFLIDWSKEELVEKTEAKFGPQSNERCFCLKIPAVFGGSYELDNIGTVSWLELISSSDDIAEQIKDLPDGSQIEFRYVE